MSVLFCCFLIINADQMRRPAFDFFRLPHPSRTVRPLHGDSASVSVCSAGVKKNKKSFGFCDHLAVKAASRVCLCCRASDYNHTRQVPVALWANACCSSEGQSSVAESSQAQTVRSRYLQRTVNNAGR